MAGRLALALAILAALGAALVTVMPDRAASADEKLTARAQVGQPVAAAEQLLKQKKFKEALAKLAEADAVPDKTPYERYVIEATRAAVDLSSGDDAGGAKALEAVLATGILAPADALARVQALAQLEYQLKNYPEAALYANRYFRDGGSDGATRILLAQTYYLENDFADSAKTIRAVLAADQAAGKRPDENILLMLLNSEYQQKDETGRIDALEMLAADYGKPEYWTDLLTAVEKKPGFSSRLTLDADLLAAETGSLNSEGAIMEAAQLALLAGLPGDAQSFLAKGYASGVLGKGSGADREKRLSDMVSRQAGEDEKTLPQLEGEAAAASTGLAWVKLGEAYASYGAYAKAIAALQKGIAKGGLQYPADARLDLGVAYLHNGEKAEARETLAGIGGTDGVRDLAQLWLILAKT